MSDGSSVVAPAPSPGATTTARSELPRVLLGGALALALIGIAPFVLDIYTVNIMIRALLLAVLALTVDLLWGYTGILTFGQSAFFGIGAYACALVFSQPVARHVLLRVRFEVPGALPIETELQIVFTAAISGARYLVRGRFLGLDDETRDRIARYVLHKQQQRLAAQSIKD